MSLPYKNLSTPGDAGTGTQETRMPVKPRPDALDVNEERSDVVPDHEPIPPWPEPQSVPGKPMRLK